jgi:hypothetical protein
MRNRQVSPLFVRYLMAAGRYSDRPYRGSFRRMKNNELNDLYADGVAFTGDMELSAIAGRVTCDHDLSLR